MPMIVTGETFGAFFHGANWVPVSPSYAAAVGERIMAKATDLGPTNPPVPDGKPFPQDPLLPVASAVTVRVDGTPVPLELKIGWPQEVNSYRLDFRVPAWVNHGTATEDVTVNGLTGFAVKLPVK